MNTKTRTITVRIDHNTVDALEQEAKRDNVSRSEITQRALESYLSGAENNLNEINFLYDIDKENLIKNIRWLLDAGKLFVVDGHLKWNPAAVNPEYFSLDDKIDAMNISEKEKVALKHKIAESLVQMNRQDGIGNGAGV